MKILIVTGRTGGHFFPAKTFAEAFQRENPTAEIHYVLSSRTSGDLLEEEIKNSRKVHYLPSFPWKGIFTLRIFSFLISISKAFFLSQKLLAQLKPDLVVGFGSYLAFPVMICARLRRIPTLIHEQNVVMGKANRMLLPYATQVAVSFYDTIDEKFLEKYVHTGNIVRRELFFAAQAKREPANGHFRILVLGGSQGASNLNKLVTEALNLLSGDVINRLRITHLAGASDAEWVRGKYKNLGVDGEVLSFSNEMGKLYRETDLVISRSGAGTLFELVLFQIPAILVPYPHAGSHQLQNARALAEGGNSWIIDERTQTPTDLGKKIIQLLHSPQEMEHVRSRMRHLLKVDDGENLSGIASNLMNGKTHMNMEVHCENAS